MNRMDDDRSYSGLVQKYIGTAYDKVAAVADNLTNIDLVAMLGESGDLTKIIALGEDIVLAAALIKFRGEWDSQTKYLQGESVAYRDSVWLATIDSEGLVPTLGKKGWYELKGAEIGTAATVGDLPSESAVSTIIARGFAEIGDGGGGTFHFDSRFNRALADGGVAVDPTKTGQGYGCWIRELHGYVTPEMWGALGIGYPVDDFGPLQSALDFGGTIRFGSKKTYYTAKPLHVRSRSIVDFNGCHFNGDDTLVPGNSWYEGGDADKVHSLFEILGVEDVVFKNGYIVLGKYEGVGLGTIGAYTGINVKSSHDILVENMHVSFCRYGFSVTGSTQVTFRSCESNYSWDDGFNIGRPDKWHGTISNPHDLVKEILFDACISRHSGKIRGNLNHSTGSAGFEVNDCYIDGLTFRDCLSFEDVGGGITTAHAHTVTPEDGGRVFMKNIHVTNCHVKGWTRPMDKTIGYGFVFQFKRVYFDYSGYVLDGCSSEGVIPISLFTNTDGKSEDILITNGNFTIDYAGKMPPKENAFDNIFIVGFIHGNEDYIWQSPNHTKNLKISHCNFIAKNVPHTHRQVPHLNMSTGGIAFDNCTFKGVHHATFFTDAVHTSSGVIRDTFQSVSFNSCIFDLIGGSKSPYRDICVLSDIKLVELAFINCLFEVKLKTGYRYQFILNDYNGSVETVRFIGNRFKSDVDLNSSGIKVNHPDAQVVFNDNHLDPEYSLNYLILSNGVVTNKGSFMCVGNIATIHGSTHYVQHKNALFAVTGNLIRKNGVLLDYNPNPKSDTSAKP